MNIYCSKPLKTYAFYFKPPHSGGIHRDMAILKVQRQVECGQSMGYAIFSSLDSDVAIFDQKRMGKRKIEGSRVWL